MKKRVLSVAAIACLILSLVACSGNGGGETPSASLPETETPAPVETDDSGLPTLEDYFNSSLMQSVIETAKEQYGTDGVSVELYASGNELRYDFTMEDLETTEEERAEMQDELKATMEPNVETFTNTAAQMKSVVSNTEVIVVVTYLDGAGNELYSQSFSSKDAE